MLIAPPNNVHPAVDAVVAVVAVAVNVDLAALVVTVVVVAAGKGCGSSYPSVIPLAPSSDVSPPPPGHPSKSSHSPWLLLLLWLLL